jgi:hypothetical protein
VTTSKGIASCELFGTDTFRVVNVTTDAAVGLRHSDSAMMSVAAVAAVAAVVTHWVRCHKSLQRTTTEGAPRVAKLAGGSHRADSPPRVIPAPYVWSANKTRSSFEVRSYCAVT